MCLGATVFLVRRAHWSAFAFGKIGAMSLGRAVGGGVSRHAPLACQQGPRTFCITGMDMGLCGSEMWITPDGGAQPSEGKKPLSSIDQATVRGLAECGR